MHTTNATHLLSRIDSLATPRTYWCSSKWMHDKSKCVNQKVNLVINEGDDEHVCLEGSLSHVLAG